MLAAHPDGTDALAELLGCSGEWAVGADPGVPEIGPSALVSAHPESAAAVAALIGA